MILVASNLEHVYKFNYVFNISLGEDLIFFRNNQVLNSRLK